MGRTLATIIQIIAQEEEAWKGFRRALRKEDQDVFDRVWRYTRHFSSSAQMANRPVPFEALAMAILVGLAKEIDELKQKQISPQ